MIETVLTLHLLAKAPDVNKVCSYLVGIPYASDNFTDEEWKRFQLCTKLLNKK